MRRKLKITWLVVTFVATVIGWYMRSEANTELNQNLTQAAEDLKAKKNYDGALAVYDYLVANDLDASGSAELGRQALLVEMNSWTRSIKSSISGFVWGDILDSASLVGCVAGDLVAWGDIRDFTKQTYRAATGGEVDEFNYALATLGLTTTVAPYADVGLSVCKSAAKFMSTEVRRALLELAKAAKKSESLDEIGKIVSSLGTTWKTIGAGTIDILQMAKDSKALTTLTKIVESGGRSAYAVLLLGGKGTLDFCKTATECGLSLTGPVGKRALRFALHYPQVAIHMAKISKKVGWDHLDVTMIALAELLAKVSVQTTMLVGLAVWLWFHWIDVLGILMFRERAAAV